jgi:hypothetical protein
MDEGTTKTPNRRRLYWCLIKFICRPETQSVMSVFSTPLVNCCPSTFSLSLLWQNLRPVTINQEKPHTIPSSIYPLIIVPTSHFVSPEGELWWGKVEGVNPRGEERVHHTQYTHLAGPLSFVAESSATKLHNTPYQSLIYLSTYHCLYLTFCIRRRGALVG